MFSPPNAFNTKLKSLDVIEQAKMLSVGNINRASMSGVHTPSLNGIGAFTNNIGAVNGVNTNDYLINQKLRNMGLYSKIKNKTVYSAGSLPHAELVSKSLQGR